MPKGNKQMPLPSLHHLQVRCEATGTRRSTRLAEKPAHEPSQLRRTLPAQLLALATIEGRIKKDACKNLLNMLCASGKCESASDREYVDELISQMNIPVGAEPDLSGRERLLFFCELLYNVDDEMPVRAASGDLDVVRWLFEQTPPSNERARAVESSYKAAVQMNRKNVVEFMLDTAGQDPNANTSTSSSVPMILFAATNMAYDVVQLLLERGARVNAAGPLGGTALMTAVRDDSLKLARLLLDYGADVERGLALPSISEPMRQLLTAH